ncbi:MAG: hypothetical protein AB2L26_08990 [Ignavibacteria bacterium]
MSNEYLNFKEISDKVLFADLFNHLNILYSIKNGEIKTKDGIVVNIKKNLYFNTKDNSQKGSVINFLANYRGTDLRNAAKELKDIFLNDNQLNQRELPVLELHYHDILRRNSISEKVALEYEVGFVKQRSIMAGKLAFKIYDRQGLPIGYIGYNEKDNSWLFPKGFKRPLYNAHRLRNNDLLVLTSDPFVAIKIVSFGITQVASLLANSMTTDQEEEIRTFKNILLLHNEPQCIVERLRYHCFIKAPCITSSFKDITKENLEQFLN